MRLIHTLILVSVAAVWIQLSYGSEKKARVFFIEPKDGAEVSQEFVAKFGIEGMELKPAGDMTKKTGHFHILIDDAVTPKKMPIPKDATHIHYGKAQTEGQLKLAPGKHKLTLLLGDGAHLSYGSKMSSTITVEVK
ncbi:MAG: DUF4399 domain-containing protein [Bdellovibrionota bacterium]